MWIDKLTKNGKSSLSRSSRDRRRTRTRVWVTKKQAGVHSLEAMEQRPVSKGIGITIVVIAAGGGQRRNVIGQPASLA